jgi:hypothetical protein
MSLILQLEGEHGDCDVRHGALVVGRIYKRSEAFGGEARWLWALNGVPDGPPGAVLTGLAATRDDALIGLAERWAKWLEWVKLSEEAGPLGTLLRTRSFIT